MSRHRHDEPPGVLRILAGVLVFAVVLAVIVAFILWFG